MIALPHPRPAVTAFVLLSGADLLLTCHLLQDRTAGFYEANWLAARALRRFGFLGLAVFKTLLVLLVGVLVWFVGRHRPTAARRLGTFACTAAGLVVVYSISLCLHLGPQFATASSDEMAALHRQGLALEQHQHSRKRFHVALEMWETRLAAGCCTLGDAVTALAAHADARRSKILIGHESPFRKTSHEERLAALVLHGSLILLNEDGSAVARAHGEELLAAYRARYSSALLTYMLKDWKRSDRPLANMPTT